MDNDTQLNELRKTIEETKAPKKETVRTVLSWFGAKRRGSEILANIDSALATAGLSTDPPLSEPYIDGEVSIHLAEPSRESRYETLVARLAHLPAANQMPAAVKRDQSLDVAMTIMLRHDYSQLPVMRNPHNVEAFVSWRTIGEAWALGHEPEAVRDCMDSSIQTLESRTPLTDAIDLVVKHEFVMVKAPDGKIMGPVTTTDLSAQYHALAQPFLLIAEIEGAIRRILDAHAPLHVMKSARHGDDERSVNGPDDLQFSEYKTALSNDEVWSKLELKLSKAEFMSLLEDVRIARNDVMHFHPDDNAEGAIRTLRQAARILDKIARASAGRSTHWRSPAGDP